MSGHNKWSKIKHTKAKNEAANAKIFTKIVRELAVAVKEGGADPSSNNKLKNVIAKAKAANMPNDNINRTIKKANGELGSINYEGITYEGYGPAGSAVIVETLTDNKNRTAGEMRHYFDKFGGSLGVPNSVSFLFTRLGEIIVLKSDAMTDDDIMMMGLEAGAQDVEVNDEYYRVVTAPEYFNKVKDFLEYQAVNIEDAQVNMVPNDYMDLPSEKIKSFNKLLDTLNDNDDVQQVYHNVNLPDQDDE